MELADSGFDFSVLSEFRTYLLSGGQEEQILDIFLERLIESGWLKSGGKQRTDSTHVLAAIRTLNRVEGVGETLRATLNDLATVAPVRRSFIIGGFTFKVIDDEAARARSTKHFLICFVNPRSLSMSSGP